MAKAKLTTEQWHEARRAWETDPNASYATIAAKFLISKALVGQRAAAEKWQKGIGVAPHPKDTTAQVHSEKLQDSPSTSHASAAVDAPMPSNSTARVVADVFVPPLGVKPINTPGTNDYADEIRIPDGLDEVDREAFVAAAIVARQRQINAKHIRELTAARAKLYGAIKGTATKEGPAQALASQRNIAALLALQQGEMDAELQRVRLEVAEFVGKPLKPTPCRIVVHMLPGEQLVGGAAAFGPNAFEVVDQQGKVI